MRTPEQIKQDLETSVEESLASLRAIKGDKAADLADHVHKMLHVGRVIRICIQDAPDYARERTMIMFAKMVAKSTEMIAHAYELPENEIVEIVQWAKMLDNKTEDVLKELMK